MKSVTGTVPLQLRITLAVGDAEPIAIGTGEIEVQVAGSYAVVKATGGASHPTVTASINDTATRTKLASALREVADQLEHAEQ